MGRSFYTDKYRLFYEKPDGTTIQLAHNADLAKLIKIRAVTFNGYAGHPYILRRCTDV